MNLYKKAVGWLADWLTWPHNGMVLENTQFRFMQQQVCCLFAVSSETELLFDMTNLFIPYNLIADF